MRSELTYVAQRASLDIAQKQGFDQILSEKVDLIKKINLMEF